MPNPTNPTEGHEFRDFEEREDEAELLPFDKRKRPEAVQPEARKPLTRKQFAELMLRQEGRCACGCKEKLVADQIIDEHVHALELGGSNDLTNRALYLKACARKKTDEQDAPQIAKGRHIRGETGQRARREKHGSTMRKPAGYISPLSKDHPRYRT